MSLIKSFALLALVALAAGQVQIKTKAKKFQPAVAQKIISREGTIIFGMIKKLFKVILYCIYFNGIILWLIF